jgi:DnaJ-domain-containing protein 1
MVWIALGSAVLLLLLLALRGFASASVAQVRAALLWSGLFLALALGGLLVLSGRGPMALFLLFALGPLAWRRWQARRLAASFGAAPPSQGPAEDVVETATLSLRIDPATGTMSGMVLRGRHAGRDLSMLRRSQIEEIFVDCLENDPDSAPLLEAWIARMQPGEEGDAPRPGASPMGREEALAVLGLHDDASPDQVRAAYLRLMRVAHPDRGGSDWLAARLNEARDTLLR